MVMPLLIDDLRFLQKCAAQGVLAFVHRPHQREIASSIWDQRSFSNEIKCRVGKRNVKTLPWSSRRIAKVEYYGRVLTLQGLMQGIVDEVGLNVLIPLYSKGLLELLAKIQGEKDVWCGRVNQRWDTIVRSCEYRDIIICGQNDGSNIYHEVLRVSSVEAERDVIRFEPRSVVTPQN